MDHKALSDAGEGVQSRIGAAPSFSATLAVPPERMGHPVTDVAGPVAKRNWSFIGSTAI
jgi:hypothetical protein